MHKIWRSKKIPNIADTRYVEVKIYNFMIQINLTIY